MNKKSIILLFFILVFLGCEKGDGFTEFGFEKIYIPQAMVTGGINDNYTVPSGGGEYTLNFNVSDGKVNVILGVLRSGSSKSAAYSVDIKSYTPSAEVLTSLGGTALPTTLYTLPNKVDVSADKTGETFYLSIDAQALLSEAYDANILVVTVEITNPSLYELAEKGTKLNVVIDVDKLKAYL